MFVCLKDLSFTPKTDAIHATHLFQCGQFEEAKKAFSALIETKPEVHTLYQLGMLLQTENARTTDEVYSRPLTPPAKKLFKQAAELGSGPALMMLAKDADTWELALSYIKTAAYKWYYSKAQLALGLFNGDKSALSAAIEHGEKKDSRAHIIKALKAKYEARQSLPQYAKSDKR